MLTTGSVRINTSSAWRVSRASRCCSATRDSLVIVAVASAPEPRTATSSPLLVAVIWMSSGLPADISGSAIAQAASSAPSRCGSRIGQRSIGTMSVIAAAADPGHMRSPSRAWRGCGSDWGVSVDQGATSTGCRHRSVMTTISRYARYRSTSVLDGAAAQTPKKRAEQRNQLRARPFEPRAAGVG